MIRIPALIVPVFLYAFSLAAEDWPQFRGAGGTGLSASKNLPVQFGPESNVIWETALPGGHSSPVLIGNSIFLTAFEDKKLLTFRLE
ncbi:MAG TPA: pyrrolo-quinoline quinone, partial [Terriglobia bacterium]|nr:pyrrolo-quinoline quinone [Terriglobia bacterium]